MARRSNPGSEVHVHPDVAFGRSLWFAGVQADTNQHASVARPGTCRELALDRDRRADGLHRVGNSRKELVGARVDLRATSLSNRAPQEEAQLGDEVGVALA